MALHLGLCLLDLDVDSGLKEGVICIGIHKLSFRKVIDVDGMFSDAFEGIAVDLAQILSFHVSVLLTNYYRFICGMRAFVALTSVEEEERAETEVVKVIEMEEGARGKYLGGQDLVRLVY